VLSRHEVAIAASQFLAVPIDDKYIGKLERGVYRWPSRAHRDALRRVFGVDNDWELGFYVDRAQPSTADMAQLVQ
jgi:hypothetical protein